MDGLLQRVETLRCSLAIEQGRLWEGQNSVSGVAGAEFQVASVQFLHLGTEFGEFGPEVGLRHSLVVAIL